MWECRIYISVWLYCIYLCGTDIRQVSHQVLLLFFVVFCLLFFPFSYEAVHILHVNRKQRISIIDQDDSSTLLHVLTNHRLLLYLVKHFTRHVSRDHPVLGLSVREIGVGCHDPSRIVSVRNTAPLIEVLQVRGESWMNMLCLTFSSCKWRGTGTPSIWLCVVSYLHTLWYFCFPYRLVFGRHWFEKMCRPFQLWTQRARS